MSLIQNLSFSTRRGAIVPPTVTKSFGGIIVLFQKQIAVFVNVYLV